MSQYSDSYSATINFLSQFDPVYRLKTTLGKAKDAEQFITGAKATVDGFKAEVEALKTERQTITVEIAALKSDQDSARVAALKRLDDEIEEKRKTADKNMRQSEAASTSRLVAINLDIDAAKAQKKSAVEEARVARVDLTEVINALAASERERKEAIAALQM